MSTHCKDPAERRNNPIGILGLLCSTLEKNYVDYVLNLNSKSLMSKHIMAINIWEIPQTSWSWRVATKIVFAHVVVSELKHLLSDFFSKRWLCIVMRTSQLLTCLPSLWPCVWRILRMRVGRIQRPILASPARLRDSYRAEGEYICTQYFRCASIAWFGVVGRSVVILTCGNHFQYLLVAPLSQCSGTLGLEKLWSNLFLVNLSFVFYRK